MMKEIHGLRVRKATALGPVDGQAVKVEDYGDLIGLSLDTASFPAVLTPEEARFLARMLNAAADRIAPAAPKTKSEGRARSARARAASLSPERRSEIASLAAAARWAK